MAPVETDSDNRISAKKKLRIVFLHSDGKESNPNSTWHDRDRLFRLQTPRTVAANEPKALVNAAKFTAAQSRIPGDEKINSITSVTI
jgi:hypothetical protein